MVIHLDRKVSRVYENKTFVAVFTKAGPQTRSWTTSHPHNINIDLTSITQPSRYLELDDTSDFIAPSIRKSSHSLHFESFLVSQRKVLVFTEILRFIVSTEGRHRSNKVSKQNSFLLEPYKYAWINLCKFYVKFSCLAITDIHYFRNSSEMFTASTVFTEQECLVLGSRFSAPLPSRC